MSVRLVPNPFLSTPAVYGPEQRAALDPEAAKRARADLRAWPVYAPTPLRDATGLAERLGVARLWIKDEGERQPLKSFKALGGAYALGEYLRDRIAEETGTRPVYEELFEGRAAATARGFRVVATTDGNHGRSLAWGAKLFGAQCTIYLPENVSEDREQAIADLGALTIRHAGNYDETLRRCAAEAAQNGWVHIQDTSHEGFTEAHKLIMEGYTLMVEEILEQLPAGERPTHTFLQVGCGGMAAAIVAMLHERWGDAMPHVVLVQSERCAPIVDTFATGARQVDTGRHDTIMIGIACGEVALLSEALLYPFAGHAMSVDDDAAMEVMRLAAHGAEGDPPLIVGETGAAGLAALLRARQDADASDAIGLDATSRVLVINSEGDTAPDVYRRIVATHEE